VSDPSGKAGPEELERSAALIDRLLRDPELRRRFRADPGVVLGEYGLPELASGLGRGERALLTLELRESRSSLAGAMVAAAAEGVDFAHVAERAMPALEHDAGRAVDRLIDSLKRHAVRGSVPRARANAGSNSQEPPLAPAAPPAHASAQAGGSNLPSNPAAQPGPAQPETNAPPEPSHLHHHHHHRAPTEPLGPNFEPPRDLLRYPGNDASPRQIAAWMGAHAARVGLPPELPVMAALTESGLRNVAYGDRDSVGFFQMRQGIWDQGPYAGYLHRPGRQIKWFIEHALAARAADPAVAQSPDTWGEWIANVEHPAAQYRFRYQLQLGTAQELLRGVDFARLQHAGQPGRVGEAALRVALRYLGTPYQWGGSNPSTGFDCSGLVQYAYAQEGLHLPRVAAAQFDAGIPVARDDLRPGDAVFFADPNGYVHHVGLYIGDGRFVNAPETGEDVKISSLSDPYFAAEYAGARRYAAAALGDPNRYARTLPTITS
jgi:cell wall-associated NlpC family hydrolase